MTGRPESSHGGVLQLKIPGQAEYIGIARLAVSGLASQLDVPYDEAEDLKLAVTEACSHILQACATPVQLAIECRFSGEELEIKVESASRAASAPPSRSSAANNGDPDLGIYLLEALMDRVEMETDERTGAMVVRMARRLPTGA